MSTMKLVLLSLLISSALGIVLYYSSMGSIEQEKEDWFHANCINRSHTSVVQEGIIGRCGELCRLYYDIKTCKFYKE
jgi:hypothetical protein